MLDHPQDWHALLACPEHQCELTRSEKGLECPHCDAPYPVRGSVVHFLRGSEGPRKALVGADGESMVAGYRKPNPIVTALRRVVSSEYQPGTEWRAAKATVSEGKAPFLTSHYPGGLHLDIDDFPGVDVVGTAERLPFLEQSVEGVLSEVVLEHVERPDRVIGEAFRVLKPGGRFFFIAPFVFPFHGHPSDFRRWSKQGIEAEFSAFDELETGLFGGPCSSMVNLLSEWAYVLTGLEFPRGYVAVKGLATLLLFPIKFLDKIVNRFPEAHRLAATLYVTGTKPADGNGYST